MYQELVGTWWLKANCLLVVFPYFWTLSIKTGHQLKTFKDIYKDSFCMKILSKVLVDDTNCCHLIGWILQHLPFHRPKLLLLSRNISFTDFGQWLYSSPDSFNSLLQEKEVVANNFGTSFHRGLGVGVLCNNSFDSVPVVSNP